jgi:glycerol-3-phosphate acyltransferase PlsY
VGFAAWRVHGLDEAGGDVMNIWIALLCALVGYLLGSIPFALVVMKVAAPGEELTGMEVDIGAEEPVRVDTVGGTAISVKLGAKYGMITALLDILKAAVPALVLKLLYPGMPYYLFAATTAVVGHNWPLYNRFKGGRGQSPMIGGFLVADWLGTLVTSFGAMILGLVILRNGIVGFLLGPWLMIPWLWFRTRDPWHLAYAVLVNLIIVVAMIPEFRSRRERARQGIAIDPIAQGDAVPMFRMMRKMGERFGLFEDLQ